MMGQAWAQAVSTSPSRTVRPSVRAFDFASVRRCTQKVHFSMTPLLRTVTSGFNCCSSGLGQALSG